jgi:hypothetical protein
LFSTREHTARAGARQRALVDELIDLIELSLTWKLD